MGSRRAPQAYSALAFAYVVFGVVNTATGSAHPGVAVPGFLIAFGLIAALPLAALWRRHRWAWTYFVALSILGVVVYPWSGISPVALAWYALSLAVLLSPQMRRYVGGIRRSTAAL